MDFRIGEKYVIIDGSVLAMSVSGMVLQVRRIDSGIVTSPGVYGTEYTFEQVSNIVSNAIGLQWKVPDFHRSVLCKIVPEKSQYMIVGKEYECIKQRGSLIVGNKYKTESCLIDSTGALIGWEVSGVYGSQVGTFGIDIADCADYFTVENSKPKRSLEEINAELYDVYKTIDPYMYRDKGSIKAVRIISHFERLLAEYKEATGKEKPGFII